MWCLWGMHRSVILKWLWFGFISSKHQSLSTVQHKAQREMAFFLMSLARGDAQVPIPSGKQPLTQKASEGMMKFANLLMLCSNLFLAG